MDENNRLPEEDEKKEPEEINNVPEPDSCEQPAEASAETDDSLTEEEYITAQA